VKPRYTFENLSVAECCEEADKKGAGFLHGVNEWTFYHDTNTCNLFQIIELHPKVDHKNCTTGIRSSILPKPCDCERVHKTVGKEYLYEAYGGRN
jgi:hypothetical protein